MDTLGSTWAEVSREYTTFVTSVALTDRDSFADLERKC